MGKKLAFERYHWFHGQIKSGRHPNARKLSEKFEISEKQAQRDIEFIRERLGAPLVYDPEPRGYRYRPDSYELPPVWFKESELMALCLSLRLASALPDPVLKKQLRELLEKFLAFRFLDAAPSLADIQRKVSVKNIEYSRVSEATFRAVVEALFRERPLRIDYYTPYQHKLTHRVILPLHLLCYMGNWHLVAYCTLKKGLRDFSLARIRRLDVPAKTVRLPRGIPPIKGYVRRNFGLMSGRSSVEVCLRFLPSVSDRIAEQVWFSGQEVSRRMDGSICLKFPVADFREVQGEILKYGASVEVLAPRDLRNRMKAEIARMGTIYK